MEWGGVVVGKCGYGASGVSGGESRRPTRHGTYILPCLSQHFRFPTVAAITASRAVPPIGVALCRARPQPSPLVVKPSQRHLITRHSQATHGPPWIASPVSNPTSPFHHPHVRVLATFPSRPDVCAALGAGAISDRASSPAGALRTSSGAFEAPPSAASHAPTIGGLPGPAQDGVPISRGPRTQVST